VSEEQVLKYIFLPIGVLFLLAAFGLALIIPIFVLLFYVGKGI